MLVTGQAKCRPPERCGQFERERGEAASPLRPALAPILQTVGKMRAIFPFLLEPVFMVMMNNN